MKGFFKVVVAAMAAMALATPGFAVDLEGNNKDAVRLEKAPYWNLAVTEASNTTYKLASKSGRALSGSNYGILGIGSSVFDVSANNVLTQGACTTLWGSATNRDVHIYGAFGNTYATSVSAASPATDITTGDLNFKIAVDNNPVVSVTLVATANDTGAEIATEMTTRINAALEAASQGARVDVAYGTVYTITSRLAGNRSKVVVTAGASASVADELKIGVSAAGVETAGSKGAQLCVSDVAGKTTVGSSALGAAGYMSCGAALASTAAVRQLASADLNCTGPVIGTVRQDQVTEDGNGRLPVKKYGTASSTTASTALVFAIKGLESGDDCVATPVSFGSGPNYVKFGAVTADTLTLTVDTTQASGTTVINYLCW